MDNMHEQFDTMKKRAKEAIEFYAKTEHWGPQEIDAADKAFELYEKLCCKMECPEEMYDGFSGARMPHMPHMSYGRGESYARGRDSRTGRYVSRGVDYDDDPMYDHESTRRGVSYERRGGRDRGYSGNYTGHDAKDQAIMKLEEAMDNAATETERQEIMKMIKILENQKR